MKKSEKEYKNAVENLKLIDNYIRTKNRKLKNYDITYIFSIEENKELSSLDDTKYFDEDDIEEMKENDPDFDISELDHHIYDVYYWKSNFYVDVDGYIDRDFGNFCDDFQKKICELVSSFKLDDFKEGKRHTSMDEHIKNW